MKKFFIHSFIILLSFFLSSHAFAKVVINEFVIDSSPQQIELFNSGDQPVDITNWYLDDSGGTTFFTIPTTFINSHACVVFSTDLNLNKSSADIIRLFDKTAPPTSSSALLQDNYSYKSSPGPLISFLRQPDGEENWATAESSLGKLNTSLVSCLVNPTPQPSPTITFTPIPTSTLIVPNDNEVLNSIYISEVMIYPNSGESEWVELYNDNEVDITLTNWYIDDQADGGSSPKLFSVSIPKKGYATIELTSSIFNNDGDSVRLLNDTKLEKNSFEYLKSRQGKTLGRISLVSDSFCLQEPSKNIYNNSCIDITPTITPFISKNISPTPSVAIVTKKIPTLVSPSQNNSSGSVLSAQDSITTIPEQVDVDDTSIENNKQSLIPYVKSFSSSSIIISLTNIGMILWKIVQRKITNL